MLSTIEQTTLWKRALANQGNKDQNASEREKLRSAFVRFREKATMLVDQIHIDLPDYTVHDITHLDALWEIADIICGDNFPLTPTEVFVLGGAILLHDAGMSLAAYPNGYESLREMDLWKDVVTRQYKERFDRLPTSEEISHPNEDIKGSVIGFLLRNLHAKQAEKLAFIEWKSEPTAQAEYLIEDNEIRQSFGHLIGQIAHSHWWSITELERKFTEVIGAPHWCPVSWMINPLKIACILRLADASHIDARRAPSFLRALRKLPPSSDVHWKFQEKLQKPYLNGDALTYATGLAFPLRDAESWWLCLDTLRMIDKELRQVDTLIAEKGFQRFAARRVAGVDSPERLASYIPTEGWLPVNAVVQVSDVPNLVKSIGGEELYGKDKTIALRELIQNSSDAIKVRRVLENRPKDWGVIRIRVGKDNRGDWFEIQDDGIGMSSQVLTQFLLDFGSSYWGSDLMVEEFPGLLATGINTTGKFGIGFFSIFMLGNSIKIYTRRFDAGQAETLVLEFNTGVTSKPIIRPAQKSEQIRDGGTLIRVWLDQPLDDGLLKVRRTKVKPTVEKICKEICPSLDVNIEMIDADNNSVRLVSSNDWVTRDSLDFFRYVCDWDYNNPPDYEMEGFDNFIAQAGENLRLIENQAGEVIGRACVALTHSRRSNPELRGAVTVGGLFACRLSNIAGILKGQIARAARDYAIPLASPDLIAKWASEQAELIPLLYKNPEDQADCAQIIRELGGDIGDLPIGYFQGNWVNTSDIENNLNLPNEILLAPRYVTYDYESIDGFELRNNVLLGNFYSSSVFVQGARFLVEWPSSNLYSEYPREAQYLLRSMGGLLLEILARNWKKPLNELIGSLIRRDEEKEIIGYIGQSPILYTIDRVIKPS